MADLEVELEEGTYTIVDGRYTKLVEDEEEEHNEESVEYLDLDMEVVEAASDNTGFYSTVDESSTVPATITSNQKTIIVQPTFLTENVTSFGLHESKKSEIKRRRQRKKNSVDRHFVKIEQIETVNGNENGEMEENSNTRKRESSENEFVAELQCERGDEYLKTTSNDGESSLDLFFRSMAQTVLQLPPQVQAKIKMDICKVISMAEIKYCTSENQNQSEK